MSDGADCPHARPRWRDHRGLLALLLATALATCTSDRPTGPGRGAVGYLAFRPVLVSPVDLTAFGLTIDSLRVAAIRPVADTVVDTTVFFDPNASSLTLKLPIELRSTSETFQLLLELRAGRRVLFSVTDTVVVTAGAPDTAFTPSDTLTYVGPGAGITHIQIAPGDSVVTETQTAAFRVTADADGTPVDSFYVSWSTSDTAVARISAAGVLRAPNARGALFVRAVTPNGVRDSTRVTFIPVPNAIATVSGGGQTGVVATRLPLPLRVRVTATDALGIKGIPVRFQAPAGGSVRDSIVTTDSAGFAEDTVTLGTAAGLQDFQATVTGLTPVVIAATGTPGAIAPALSVVTVSAGTVVSGATITLRLQTKDAFGNNLTTGGDTVAFTDSGGTSTGVIGTATDSNDGTYQATFLGGVAGTPTSIKATVNGVAVTTARPTVSVTAGAISVLTSVVSTSSGTVSSGSSATLTLQAKDSVGNLLTSGGAAVAFTRSGGTSTGTIGAPTDHANGTYTATFTADSAGTATTIGATIGGVAVVSTTTITVVPGNTVAAQSVITVSADTIPSGGTSTLTLQAKDGAGNNITTGGLTVVFSFSGGTSTGTIAPSPATDNGNGTYTATFTGVTPGTATTIHATIGGVQVTSTLPTITVFSSVHVSNITADSTWTAAASPHIVSGYLKITNGAKLTIQAGAVVKFNAASGLQVGDTAAGLSGDLALDGTAGLITLTANSASPGVGFWKGIEVQRSLTATTWRNVLIEWAGGPRAPAGAVAAEACVLLVNNSGAAVNFESLHIRQCNHAAIHHFGGTAHVLRSEIDTVTGSGIHVDFNAQLELDSTTIRGAGQEGLFFGSPASRLLPSSGNRFLGNLVTGIHLNAFQLPGLLKQDSIAGNGTNFIVVDGGRPDSSVAAFTLFAQPQPVGLNGYLIQNGSLDIGRVGGQALTLDSNVVLRFNGQTGLFIGDSAGTRSGTLQSLATSAANRAVLVGSAGTFPGAWVGVEIGRLSGPDTLRFVRIDNAGDSIPGRTAHHLGLWVRHPGAATFVLDHAVITGSGATGNPLNSAGIAVTGTGGVEIRNSTLFQNVGYGIALDQQGFKVVADTIDGQSIGIAAFMKGGSQLTAADAISGNVLRNNQYAMSLTAAALRALGANVIATPVTDTLLFEGGQLTADATLPHIPGFVWRATGMTQVDSGATLTMAAGDTVAFDSSAGIQVGALAPAALAVDGSAGRILLTASGPLPQGWRGVDFHLMSGSGSTTNNVFRHVDVDRAGFFGPCVGAECSPTPFGALRFTDSLVPTNVNLAVSDLIVRRSSSIALDFQRAGSGTVSVVGSQFYQNVQFSIFRFGPNHGMIRARPGHANQLSISGSDLYHYRDWAIETVSGSPSPTDSVLVANNWWGDVLGPDTVSQFSDSLGRASTNGAAALVTPFATTPFFPVGPPAGMTTTVDSLLGSVAMSDSVGIHARAVDTNGRGVVGQAVNWTPIPASPASFITPASSISDIGGRVDAIWKFTNVAGPMTAHAVGGGGFTDYFINVAAGFTVPPTAWTLLPALSEGNVSGNTIAFTSSNRRGVLVTNAHDSFGNATQPFNLCFSTANDPSCGFPYGAVDSVHHGTSTGDTIYFHASVTQPATFVLRGLYTIATGGQTSDSVVINMFSIPFGVRIDRDEFTPGTQVTPDTLTLNAICPGGQPNFFCQREVLAVVVDSGLAPVANQDAVFRWTLVPAAGAPVSLSVRGTPANDSATVTALANGFVRLVATDTTPNNFGADTLPIQVTQLPGIIAVTPPLDSVLVGGTLTFNATAIDLAGDTMPAVPIHWRIDNTFNPHLSIVDTATPHQVVVRLDSTPFGSEGIRAFAVRGPGDTLYGFAQVTNPLLKQVQVGLEPWAIAANTQTHVVYAGHQSGPLYKIDGTTNAVVDSIAPGLTIGALAVNSSTNRLFASTNLGVAVIDETNFSTIATVPTGTNSPGVTNLQGLTVDSVGNRVFVTVAPPGASPLRLLRQIDGATNTFSLANDVALPDTGVGAAFNPANGLVYVTIPDSNMVVVVDPSTHAITKRIAVGSAPAFIAVNPATNRVYVVNQSSNDLSVIDAASGTVVSTVPLGYFLGSVAVDVVHNRIYIGVINLPYLLVVNGATDAFENILLSGNPSFSEAVRGVVVDGAIGNGLIFTSNYSTGTVSRLQF